MKTQNKVSLVLPITILLFVSLTLLGIRAYKVDINHVSDSGKSYLPVYGKVADFELIERSNQRYQLSNLNGYVWIADFIFSRCAGVCNLMSGEMAVLQRRFINTNGIMFVSFSVDPEYDSPEVLSRYANKYQADKKKWLFMTGDKEDLFNLSEQHFLLGVQDIPIDERQSEDQLIRHSSKFALVDKQGNIRGYYDSNSKQNLDQLYQDALYLLKVS